LLVMTERVNHERVFFYIFVCMRTVESTPSDSLLYLFGCYVFYCGGGNGDNLRGEQFCARIIAVLLLGFLPKTVFMIR